MPERSDILWFKTQFQSRIKAAIEGTALSVDFITAIACQETGDVWPALVKRGLPVEKVLALCVGDTLDADKGRKAFPRTKADLLQAPRGPEMFSIAHQALVEMAAQIPGYAAVAKNPDKFCHGFGLFQLDLQSFGKDPDYFLNRDYAHFDKTLGKCVAELKRALKKLKFSARATLTDEELAAVGIAYNTGGFKPAKGLKQGHFDGHRYYGEAILDYLKLAHSVQPPEGRAMKVATRSGTLNLRSTPDSGADNVIGQIPNGQCVQAYGSESNGFVEIEARVDGAAVRGFAASSYLVAEAQQTG
ncbi:SH3 domain-containing protein [Niveibacterium terrae]|uniref:SH3 domain-containing protein n=1 Tax=Niveibacterium terrae TaxID=3373598 RepID=UPI003A8D408A